MRERRRKQQRGFTLIVVIMVVAVAAMVAVSLLNLIRLDLSLVGQSRRAVEARVIADGAAMEMVNDLNINTLLPDGSGALSVNYTPPASSPYNDASLGRSYTGTINMMRSVPMAESSFGRSEAVVYELEVESIYNGGQSSSEVRAEVYKVVTRDPSRILAKRHAR